MRAKALPVRFWHARQWHIEIRSGSPSQEMLSWPHEHEAVRMRASIAS